MEDSWFGRAAEYFNTFEAAWQKWVVNYDADKQTKVLKLLDNLPWKRILFALTLIAALAGVYIGLRLRKKLSDAEYIKQKLRHLYSNTKFKWECSETPREWTNSLILAGADKQLCLDWLNAFENTLYGNSNENTLKYLTRELRQNLKRLK